jgi:hypothetical protein
LYYFKEKRLAVVFLVMGHCLFLFSQVKVTSADSLQARRDTLVTDTTLKAGKLEKGAIDKPITYGAKGYRKSNLDTKKVYLVDEGVVTYGDITLKADSIVLDMETKSIYAVGRKDSTGKVIGSPNFKQGTQSFDSKELNYNFSTGKARVMNMVTKQEDGYLHSGVTKKFKDGTFNISKSTYSTCDADPPHFYVGFNKAKVVPGKKIITGPAYMVLEDIPLPLALPFGFFPIQTKRAATGIIIPKLGQSANLGYSLRDGGYYFAISDNFDLSLTGDIYTNGTWVLNATSNYIKRYKFTGKFAVSYASNVSGHKGLSDYSKSSNYRINWTYNQDSKANPGSRFSASVSMSSSAFDRQNSYVPSEHVNTTRQSSISYSKTFTGTPFDFSTSINQSQNVALKTMFLNLPKASFGMQRIYPLKPKNMTGQAKWWQELQFQYSASVDNQINSYDSLLFTKAVFKNMKNGFKHDAPLSLQIRPFRKLNGPGVISSLLQGITLGPTLTYSGVLYTQKFNYRWDPDFYNSTFNKIVPRMVKDTIRGIFYGQAMSASIGTGITPQIFGTYTFKNPNAKVQAIRHVMKPSVSFSYVPYLKGLSTNMYQTVQIDTLGKTGKYSIFDGNIYGTPSLPQRNGTISFGLVNTLEAKIFQKDDTTGKPKKVKLIDNFSINTSYSVFADSLKWAPLVMNYRSVLFENLNIAATGNFNFYGLDSKGATHNTSYWEQEHKPLRLTGFSTSLDLDVGKIFQKNKKTGTQQGQQQQPPNPEEINPNQQSGKLFAPAQATEQPKSALPLDQYGYVNFDMPWSLRLAYNYSYSKPGLRTSVTQTVTMQGDVALTKKMKLTYTTGYDIDRKALTMTSIGIYRDLHCWEMSIDWIPIGYMKSWSFTIKVKSSVLADLKYDRRKDYHDQY